ncbi:MAG: dehydrogenase [Planctomycetaceae bacterium]|nr:MAG: dehydrogenase [Planctomycetaceae bacterium]
MFSSPFLSLSAARRFFCGVTFFCVSLGLSAWSTADEPFIPRKQSQPPGPPLTPEQALQRMVVPEGFRVELVASEPDLVNPVAMAFDDAGRLYVTESFEYPRRSPGPGRDRVKLLEDTNGDGRFDSVTVFADGLNIPSGIAVGHGGVWVANAPDILFLRDTDGDGVADERTTVVTGFGRDDTHELPNALTWGPDGYLYGLNGVFNRSVIRQEDRTIEFTAAMFRIDPVTHRFELFAEGTSNPWGIAFDTEGEAFVSACVIDHLWHLTESGYYHRQAGAYPPHTWKIDSIVSHKHQMAAYCGLEFFDSPAYPPEYRNRFYMGNIHGGCINVDSVERHGSTYRGSPHPDFLTANDVWFMPVAQKMGPDGCLYILDWYDRYHCYQDANADPDGVDRGHGRLYRVVHDERPAIEHRDLQAKHDSELVDLLVHPNGFYRQRAAVLLNERLRTAGREANAATFQELLTRLTADPAAASMELLTTTVSAPQIRLSQLAKLQAETAESDPRSSAWAVRAAGERLKGVDAGPTDDAESPTDRWQVGEQLLAQACVAKDPRIRLQAAIALGKLPASLASSKTTERLLQILHAAPDDGLLPRIVWKHLEPRVRADQAVLVREIAKADPADVRLRELVPRIATRLLADVRSDLSRPEDSETLASLLRIADSLAAGPRSETPADQPAADHPGSAVLKAVLTKLQTGEIRPAAARPTLAAWAGATRDNSLAAAQLRALAGDPAAIRGVAERLLAKEISPSDRRELLATVSLTAPDQLLPAVDRWANDARALRPVDEGYRDALVDAVVLRGDAPTQQALLRYWEQLPIGARARAASAMLQRESTAERLLNEIIAERLEASDVGPEQIRQLAASPSATIRDQVRKIWGTVRLQDAAHRQQVVRDTTQFLLKDAHGDPQRGWAVYDRICGQCHRMHNRGYEVGPELTRNGRSNFEQLVVSVFDPSLVIGEAYQSVTVVTADGRALSGLVTERSDQRIVLKVQGGKTEIVPTDEIEELQQNVQSMMPEGLEEQMTRQELADLFALLTLELPPEQTDNRVIAGTPEGLHARP